MKPLKPSDDAQFVIYRVRDYEIIAYFYLLPDAVKKCKRINRSTSYDKVLVGFLDGMDKKQWKMWRMLQQNA